jgi:hypothetical protein
VAFEIGNLRFQKKTKSAVKLAQSKKKHRQAGAVQKKRRQAGRTPKTRGQAPFLTANYSTTAINSKNPSKKKARAA